MAKFHRPDSLSRLQRAEIDPCAAVRGHCGTVSVEKAGLQIDGRTVSFPGLPTPGISCSFFVWAGSPWRKVRTYSECFTDCTCLWDRRERGCSKALRNSGL